MTDSDSTSAGGRFVLAIDVGGTKVESALVDLSGVVVRRSVSRASTGADISGPAMAAALDSVVRRSLAAVPPGADVAGVGVASAGPIDHRAGTISPVNMAKLGGNYPLVDVVRDIVGLGDVPIRLGHDGGCLAMAESSFGATRGAETSMTFVVSTGIGGGIVQRGELFRGRTGNAGHLGQMLVNNQTLEELASGPASIRWAQSQGWRGDTGQQLGADAAQGGEIARAAIRRSAEYVGAALAGIAALIDVDIFAIGGGFSFVAEDYVDLIEARLRRVAPLSHIGDVPVVRSALGAEGPLIGAASLVTGSVAPSDQALTTA